MDLSTTPTIQARNPLLQFDLFLCILDYFIIPDWSQEGLKERYQALIALALTCRALTEPSLDHLWRKLISLRPLIRCFAPVWNEDRKHARLNQPFVDSLCSHVEQTPLSSAEWAVVNRYSYRIKELKFDSFDDPESYSFFQAVNSQPCVLLPNLSVLFWRSCIIDDSEPVSVTLLQRLLGPSLVSADLFLTSMDDVPVQSFLANFLLLCPNLKSISITHDEFARWNVSRTTIDLLSQAIAHYQHFERLSLHVPINDVALTSIAMSPKVKGLSLVLHPDKSCLHQFRLSLDTIPFHHVEDLFLQIWDLDFLTALLRTEGQMFRSFHFNLCARPTIQSLSAFLDALASPPRACSLQSLCLQLSLDESDEPQITTPPARLSYITLRPLARLSQLCELYIVFDHCLVMDDNDLTSLARHWPLLRMLQLSGCGGPHEHFWQPRKRITLNGLLSLVECCPHLHWFSLPVDATKVPPNSPGRWASNPKLSCISMTEAPIREPLPVARFLHRHFPYLDEVDVTFHQPSLFRNVIIYEMGWCQVNESLKDLRGLQKRLGISYY